MNTTQINNIEAGEAISTLQAIAKVEAIYCNSPLIESDMRYAVKKVRELIQYDCTGDYYIAIRQNGVEDHSNKEYIKERCKTLGQPHVAIKVTRKEDGLFDMIINKAA